MVAPEPSSIQIYVVFYIKQVKRFTEQQEWGRHYSWFSEVHCMGIITYKWRKQTEGALVPWQLTPYWGNTTRLRKEISDWIISRLGEKGGKGQKWKLVVGCKFKIFFLNLRMCGYLTFL